MSPARGAARQGDPVTGTDTHVMVFWRRWDTDALVGQSAAEEVPELLPSGSRAVRAAVAGRIAGYTPEWAASTGDAGVALVKVFGKQAAPIVERTNRLREKYRREQLRIGGVRGRGAGLAEVALSLTLLDTVTGSVEVPVGSQFVAPGTTGDQVVFESTRTVFATPARVGLHVVESGTRAVPVNITAAAPALVLGRDPQPGSAWWLGFDGPAPAPRLTFEVELAEPAAADGDDPVFTWDLLTATGLEPADLLLDETRGLQQDGIVEVATGGAWPALRHPALPTDQPDDQPNPPRRWLRVGFSFGRYARPPRVGDVRLNVVRATGAETIRDEVLEPVEVPGEVNVRRFRLSRTPVLPGTVDLVIDAPDPADLFDIDPARPGAGPPQWTEVADLAGSRPYERHFVLDESTGVLTFGDGVHGAAVPDGFRHVLAVSYRTGGGAATAVPAAAGFVPRGTIAGLSEVGNARPAAGGFDAEPIESLLRRGPGLLRARESAVTAADAEVLAVDATGAVGRVIALPGLDARGVVRPGRITLLVVSAPGADAPGADTLRAVREAIAAADRPLAPLGSTVVVEAARYVPVELEIAVRLAGTADAPETVRAVVTAANRYLDPVSGGDDGRGWPLGQAIRYRRLFATVAAVTGVDAVVWLTGQVAGRPVPACRYAPSCTRPPAATRWRCGRSAAGSRRSSSTPGTGCRTRCRSGNTSAACSRPASRRCPPGRGRRCWYWRSVPPRRWPASPAPW